MIVALVDVALGLVMAHQFLYVQRHRRLQRPGRSQLRQRYWDKLESLYSTMCVTLIAAAALTVVVGPRVSYRWLVAAQILLILAWVVVHPFARVWKVLVGCPLWSDGAFTGRGVLLSTVRHWWPAFSGQLPPTGRHAGLAVLTASGLAVGAILGAATATPAGQIKDAAAHLYHRVWPLGSETVTVQEVNPEHEDPQQQEAMGPNPQASAPPCGGAYQVLAKLGQALGKMNTGPAYAQWNRIGAGIIGCPTGTSQQLGEATLVETAGGKEPGAVIWARGEKAAVIFGPDAPALAGYVNGARQVGHRHRWGLGTTQWIRTRNGSCVLAQRYGHDDVRVYPSSVALLAVRWASRNHAYPRLTRVSGGSRAVFEITGYVSTPTRPWPHAVGSPVRVRYDRGTGLARLYAVPRAARTARPQVHPPAPWVARDRQACGGDRAGLLEMADALELAAHAAK